MMGKKILLLLPILMIMLSACGKEAVVFQAGDMRTAFCGTHLNYQYCECAFNGNFCEQIVMSRGDAEKHVQAEYDKWVQKERQNFFTRCEKEDGIIKKEKCIYCGVGKISVDGKCKKKPASEKALEPADASIPVVPGGCREDSECASICEGNTSWIRVCDRSLGSCEKSLSIDCSLNLETFAEFTFPMICEAGECVRDSVSVSGKKDQLASALANYQKEKEDMALQSAKLASLLEESEVFCEAGDESSGEIDMAAYAQSVSEALGGEIPEPISLAAELFADLLERLYSQRADSDLPSAALTESELGQLGCELANIFRINAEALTASALEVEEHIKTLEGVIGKLPVS
jgi:hypothetical protein